MQIDQISQIILVVGRSVDSSARIAKDLELEFPNTVKYFEQIERGKKNAIFESIGLCVNQRVIIHDGDRTVKVSSLKKMIQIALLNENSLVLGNRINKMLHTEAMPNLNRVCNRLLALLWRPIIGFDAKDLLCGTKIFPKQVFSDIHYWASRFDDYGDLIIIAASRRLDLSIRAVDIEYVPRSYGKSTMRRFKSGLAFLFFTVLIYVKFLNMYGSIKLKRPN